MLIRIESIPPSTYYHSKNFHEPFVSVKTRNHFIGNIYSEKDGGYIADPPDLRYCSAFGDTPDEALREVQIAKQVWLEAAIASGMPIPEPRYRPVTINLQLDGRLL